MSDNDLASATGLAIAAIAGLLERSGPIPKGEVARCLSLLAQAAPAERPGQTAILNDWAQLAASRSSARDV